MHDVARVMIVLALLTLSLANANANEATVASPSAPPALAGWLGDGSAFWYRDPTGFESHVFHLIDLARGSDTPLCDHAALAAALTKVSGRSFDANSLPLERISVHLREHWLRFRCAGRRFHYYPLTKTLMPLPDDIDPDPRPVQIPAVTSATANATAESDAEVFVQIHNGTQYDAISTWISDTGERRSYGALLPGESRKQHTYAGHHWEIATAGGLPLAAITATPGMSPVMLIEPADGVAAPWRASSEGTTLTLQHVSEPRSHRLDLTPDHPTGAIRSDPTGTYIAVSIHNENAPRWSLGWRLFRLGATTAEAIALGKP